MLLLHNESVHTFDARRSQIHDLMAHNPHAIVAGSIARAAVLGFEMPTRKKGAYVRDIDVVSTEESGISLDSDISRGPFPVDVLLRGLIVVKGGVANIRYRADRPDVSVDLPAEVFEPYPVNVSGSRLQTLHPDTLLNIHRVIGTYNPRIWKNLKEFRNMLEAKQYKRIPDVVFDPLTELQRMASQDPELRKQKMTEQVMALYGYFVPPRIRSTLKPLATVALKTIGVESRNGVVSPR